MKDSFDAVGCPTTSVQQYVLTEISSLLEDSDISAVFKVLEGQAESLSNQLNKDENAVALEAAKDSVLETKVHTYFEKHKQDTEVDLMQLEKDLSFQLRLVKCLQARMSPDLVAVDFALGALSTLMKDKVAVKSSLHYKFIFGGVAVADAVAVNDDTEVRNLQTEINEKNAELSRMAERVRQFEALQL